MEQWTFISDLEAPHIIDGRSYRIYVEGRERPDGTWAGRVVFKRGDDTLITGQETSQPNRGALAYWATGLEQVYLEGAVTRAKRVSVDDFAGAHEAKAARP